MLRKKISDVKIQNNFHNVLKVEKKEEPLIKSKEEFEVEKDKKDPEEKIEKKTDSKIDYYLTSRGKSKKIDTAPDVKEKSKRPVHKWIIFSLIAVIIMWGIYYGASYFEKAQVNIVAKQENSTFTTKIFQASKDGGIGFEIMIMSGEESKDMTLTNTENVSRKSKGEVTFFNEYTKTSQKLLIGTFISDDNGKTYNTDKAIEIPGYTLDKNKKIIPGTTKVGITAFLPGASYNGSPTNFHIVNFKNTDKYQKIYAKANTPITGGAQGLMYVLSEKEKSAINDIVDKEIKPKLLRKLNAEVPSDYIFYPGSIIYSYDLGNNELSENNKSEVKINYDLTVVLLKRADLNASIVKNILPNITEKQIGGIEVVNLSELIFAFQNPSQLINKETQSVPFNLTGNVKLVWRPNIGDISNKLLGIEKGKISSIFESDKSVTSVNLKMFPPWKKVLPSELSRIKITVN